MAEPKFETILSKLHKEALEKENAASVVPDEQVSLLLRKEAGELRELAERLKRKED
jgi:hypothetical protein